MLTAAVRCPQYHENTVHELVREVGGDLVEEV